MRTPTGPTHKGRPFLLLLCALSFLLTAYPLAVGGEGSRIGFNLLFEVVLLAGLFALRSSRVWFALGLVLVLQHILTFWGKTLMPLASLSNDARVESIGYFSMAAFLGMMVVFVLRDLFSSRHVTADRLCGAVSGYMMLGLVFGALFTGFELLAPGSFAASDNLGPLIQSEGQGSAHPTGLLFYFSYVSLTTLGIGDVTPTSPVTQMLTLWEAIIGQVYLTILVARLVGLHVSAGTQVRA